MGQPYPPRVRTKLDWKFLTNFSMSQFFTWPTKNLVHPNWTCGEPGWLTNPLANKGPHIFFFVIGLGWVGFFSQHIGLTNANLIFLWFWFVFGVEHYFLLYLDCIEMYLYFNHNYNLVCLGLKKKIVSFFN